MKNLSIFSIIFLLSVFWSACEQKIDNTKPFNDEDYNFVAPSELAFTLKDFHYDAAVGEGGTAKPIGGKIGTLLCNDKVIDLENNEFENGFITTKEYGKIKILFSSSLTETGMAIYLTNIQKKALLDFIAKW